jgi:hypothetical protein
MLMLLQRGAENRDGAATTSTSRGKSSVPVRAGRARSFLPDAGNNLDAIRPVTCLRTETSICVAPGHSPGMRTDTREAAERSVARGCGG